MKSALLLIPLALAVAGCATQSDSEDSPVTVTETLSNEVEAQPIADEASSDYQIGSDTPVDSRGSMLDIMTVPDPSPIAGTQAQLKCMALVADQYVPEQKPVKYPEIEDSPWKVWQRVEGVSVGNTEYAARMHFTCMVSGDYAELSTFVPE